MAQERVKAGGEWYEISVGQASKTVWWAVGHVMGERTEISARSRVLAIRKWGELADWKLRA